MKTILLTIAALGLAVSLARAHECPLRHSLQAKTMAAEGDDLHKAGKHDESVAKYDEAAKAMGITLTHKPK